MKILLTNHQIVSRTGSELFVAELALSLREAGHGVAIYTPHRGELAAWLEGRGVAVRDDPATPGFVPEIVHAQHHLPALLALLAHRDAPAIYLCHGSVPWPEHPPIHPRIALYAGTSPLFQPWFASRVGIPAERFRLVRNHVDLSRFDTVGAPWTAPRRALLYQSTVSPEGAGPIARGCQAAGVSLDLAGRQFERVIPDPERVLPGYDVVFSSGRSALEAAACGCAVIPLDGRGCGPALTPGTFDALRDRNFTPPDDAPAPGAEAVAGLLGAVRAEEARAVTARVRDEHGLERNRDLLLELYAEALALHRAAAPVGPEEELRALARDLAYLEGATRRLDERNRSLAEGWDATKRKWGRAKEEREALKRRLELERRRLRTFQPRKSSSTA